jgi:hypothetical protein
MKKVLIATNILFISIIWFQACKPSGIVQKSVSYFNCATTETRGHTMKEFMDVVSRYKTNYADVITKWALSLKKATDVSNSDDLVERTFQDSRSVWFPLDTIKKFICTVEKYSTILNIPSESLGINFYFATYGQLQGPRANHSYHHTLYFVPTMRGRNGNVDFDPRNSVSEKRNLDNIFQIGDYVGSDQNESKNMLVLGGEESNPLDDNKGQGCPPECTTDNRTIPAIDGRYPRGNHYVPNRGR